MRERERVKGDEGERGGGERVIVCERREGKKDRERGKKESVLVYER